MDPLSDVLRAVRMIGGVFIEARLTAPWCITANMDETDCRPFLPGEPLQMICYHYVIEGEFGVSIDGSSPVRVQAGEAVIFPRNDPHLMASGPGIPPVRAGKLIQQSADGSVGRIVHGGNGAVTRLVCGFLASAEGFNPLIETLPPLLTVNLRECVSRDWIEASVRFAAAELANGRLASSEMLSRLSELLFVEAVRLYADGLPRRETGWLRGLSDPQIGRAIAAIHRDIAAPWSADSLAREVGMSRSAFVERFGNLVGQPPMRYVTLWRLQSARRQLRDGNRSIARLAHDVGYGSEEAFSRAFKREFGLSPAHWRERDPTGR